MFWLQGLLCSCLKGARFLNRTWLITGASSGLGFAIAKAAANAGDTVVGCVRKADDANRLQELGKGVFAKLLDVRSRSDVFAVVSDVISRHGAIDIAVNNAGYGLIGPIEEVSEDEARAQFDVNVFGALWFIQAVLPNMRKRSGGHIINITSVSGLAPWAGTGLYTASKYALEGLTQTLHDEVEEYGIDVTNVAPGGLRTNFSKGSMVMPKQQIPDYQGLARLPQVVYKDGAGREPGDPDKAADAIISVAGQPNPPLHLLLGSDAVGYWRAKQEAMAAEIRTYEALSDSISVDDP